MKFKEIGWNGYLIKVPEEMHLTRQGGNANKGTFFIESEDSLIEFSWNPLPKESKSLLSIVEQITDRIKKDAGKKKINFSIEEKKDAIVNNHDAIYLRLKYGIEERYYVWKCQESNRLIAIRFVFKEYDEKSRKIVKQLISTIKCHTEEKNIWSLMKLHFEAPKTFLLNEARIEIGKSHIELIENEFSAFEERKRTIYVDYFPMANLRFKDTYEDPEKWFEKNYLKDFKKIMKKRKIDFKTVGKKELGGHEIIIKQAEMMSGLSTRSTDLCSAALWYCPEMNRMYFIAFNSKVTRLFFLKRKLNKKEHNELFNEILESFQCH
ncbi:TPA: hypothetical protein EYP75_01800 [Candidatus Bathyarchaeota archaeon]|nr:hypothetical protein [Candidatus Bathyarchaeota archaeon]